MTKCKKVSASEWQELAARLLLSCCFLGLSFCLPAQAAQGRRGEYHTSRNPHAIGSAHTTPAPPVQICVVVRNERGQAVDNLRRDNFRVWDNGRLQRISDFGANVVPAPVLNLKVPGTVRYTALYFDDLHYNFVDTIRVTDSAYSFFGSALGPRNKVGVFTSSGEVTLNFTDNRKKFHQALLAIRPHLPLTSQAKACPPLSDYQAYMLLYANDPIALRIALADMNGCQNKNGQADPPMDSLPMSKLRQMKRTIDARAQEVIAESDTQSQRTLQGLNNLISKVATLPDPRAIIVASPGFLTGSQARQADLLARRATRLHIIMSALDTTGLIQQLPDPAPTHNRKLDAERDAIVYAKNQMMADRASMASDVLLDLSTMTGGNFVANMDDLESGFKSTVPLPPAYYVLGYFPNDARDNGRFHSIRVRVVGRGLMGVQAPPGYYAPGTASQIVRSSLRDRHSKRRRK